MIRRPPRSTRTYTLFPYTTRFRSDQFPSPTLLTVAQTDLAEKLNMKSGRPYWPTDLPVTRQRDSNHRHADFEDVQSAKEKRSEEHTSELQSLMRISYAVFCLTKKKQKTKYTKQYNEDTTQKN